ncbi:TolC family protein [Alishewanella jeotgali]|uniref:Cobalt/zinc/cadmium efflux RND transporter outermembrane protein n=1 Tax=Alishewanella jeotgali KCTC 22429 TaxID=1129374 RepID=H3ZI10_9ALTE|nr:TolC family protein [Alishewanella jeotgali]EHR40016.1 cobalt/zinc/cadmium efflux RND transporter outermembrane protein [Alishewanella jeotgali KCTC 22429]
MFLKSNTMRFAAFGLLVASSILLHQAVASEAATADLTLQQAAKKVLQQHPQLQVFDWRLKAAAGQQQLAELNPGYELGLQADNAFGTGDMSGVKSLEVTVSLSSVIELGDKRQARMAVSSANQELLLAQRQAASLDLLGELTQRFVTVLTLQQKMALAAQTVSMTEQALTLVTQRVQRGAAPEAEQLRAKVAFKQAQLQHGLLQTELDSSKLALVSLWGAEQADFNQVSGDLFQLAQSPSFQTLYQHVLATPTVEVFAARQRLRDAELTLTQSQSAGDVRWQLGAMRSQESRDFGLVAGVSVPLFSKQRNQGAITAAQAESQAEQFEKETALLDLRARLYQAWQTHRYSSMAVKDMQRDILPLLEQALQQTEDAYRRGRYGYAEWISARQALQDAQLELVNAASTALSNQVLIEQLTGVALAASPLAITTSTQLITTESGSSK